MAHARSAILAAIKAALAANPAISRVYAQRLPPLRQVWPSVLVYAEAETVEALEISTPRQYLRELTVVCKGFVRQTEDDEAGEAALDALAVEIEDTLLASGITAEKDMVLASTEWGAEEIGDLLMLYVSLAYRISYATVEYYPETAT